MPTGSYVKLFDNFYYGIHPSLIDPQLDIDVYLYLTQPEQAEVFTGCEYYYEFPITDRKACTLKELKMLVRLIRSELSAGRKVYVACKGGHGRSGLVAGAVVAREHGWSYSRTKAYLRQEWRSQRRLDFYRPIIRKLGTPQTRIQKQRLREYCEYLASK